MTNLKQSCDQRLKDSEWEMRLPVEWKTGEWDIVEVMAEGKMTYGTALLVTATLDDGTNIIAVTWRSGQRVLRFGPANGWKVEERFTGREPVVDRALIDDIWKKAHECLQHGIRETERELGPVTVETDQDRAKWLLSKVPGAADGLRYAFAKYRESDPDCTFEKFELGIQILAETGSVA